MSTNVYILNRSPTHSVEGMTPFEAWHSCKPVVCHLRTFGFIAHAKSTLPNIKKLEDQSKPMIFVGYEPSSKAYHTYNLSIGQMIITHDVEFDEATKWEWVSRPAEAGIVPMDTFVLEYSMCHEDSSESSSSPMTSPQCQEDDPTGVQDSQSSDIKGVLDIDHDNVPL